MARPAPVDVLDVDLVVDVHVLEQVEEEQRHVGVGAGADVGHRADPAQARVQLTEVELAAVQVDADSRSREVRGSPRRAKPVAELARELARALAVLRRQRLREDVVAAPAAAVGGELRIAGEVGHERPDDRAVPRDARLHRHGPRVDPPHHLELLRSPCPRRSSSQSSLVCVRRRSSCPSRRRASARRGRRRGPRRVGEREQLVVARGPPEHVRDARHARLVPELRRHDLRVEPVAKLRRRERHLEPGLGGTAPRSPRRRTRTPPFRPARASGTARAPPRWLEQVVADLLDRVELPVGALPRARTRAGGCPRTSRSS